MIGLFLHRLLELVTSPVASVFENVRSVPCYRDGFVAATVGALIVGWISNRLLYWWNRVLQFFGPTLKAATELGPSPMDRLAEAMKSLVFLDVAVALPVLVLRLATAGTF